MDIWTWERILRNRTDEKTGFPLILRYGHNTSEPPHRHQFLELVQVLTGTADHYFHPANGKIIRQTLHSGDIFLIQPGRVHSFCGGNDFYILNLCLDPVLIPADFRNGAELTGLKILFRKNPGILHVNLDCREELENCQKQLMQELHERKPGWREAAAGLFRYLLILLGRLPEKGSPEAQEYTPPVRKAIEFLQTHMAEKITLREVALAAGIGKSLLCQKFRREVGKTPWQLLNSLRIGKAVFYLKTGKQQSISETAYLCGFEDSGYFSRIFRRETGITPTRCRDEVDL